MKFSLDLDGVVADYGDGLRRVAARLNIAPQSQPVGLEPMELDALMRERQQAARAEVSRWIVDNVEEFYGGLASLVQAGDIRAINVALAEGHELFWVSNRGFGYSADGGTFASLCADTTFRWLQAHDLPVDDRHLVLTYDKAASITENGIKCHLDDVVPHVTQIALETGAQVYLLRRPWNQRIILQGEDQGEYRTTAAAFGVPEVGSIAEYVALATGRQM